MGQLFQSSSPAANVVEVLSVVAILRVFVASLSRPLVSVGIVAPNSGGRLRCILLLRGGITPP
jgi:hypothetical protein